MNYCLKCGFAGQPKQYRPGGFLMEVGLWLFFLIPGLIYSIGKLSTHFPGAIYSIWTLVARYLGGTFPMDYRLWLLLLVPGVIYSIWRMSARYQGCAKCGSKRIVPANSPAAQAALGRLSPTPSAQSWVCMSCGEHIFGGGRFCPSCGAAQPLR